MLRVLSILLICVTLVPEAQAGFWDKLFACFKNPCNCGGSNYKETRDGQEVDHGPANRLCPPYCKTCGRKSNTCLVQYGLAGNFSVFKQDFCAQYSPETNFFRPTIELMGQLCNAGACWVVRRTLAGLDGPCVNFVGPYVFPPVRLCARITSADDPDTGTSADPGYTPSKHLNFEGVSVDDEPVRDRDGNEIEMRLPKLCLFEDPSFVNIPPDLLDLNLNKQPFHNSGKLHPLIETAILVLDVASQTNASASAMLKQLVSGISGEDGGILQSVLDALLDTISWLVDHFAQLFSSLLKEVGQINRFVDSKVYGCVNIPLSPYPPPFCPDGLCGFEQPVVERICETDFTGIPRASVLANPCTFVKGISNNFISNAVRIGYDATVPLCRRGENPLADDRCVNIEGLPVYAQASFVYSVLAGGTIPNCTSVGHGGICVRTMLKAQEFRPVYAVRTNGELRQRQYYVSDLPDCVSSSSGQCQELWGVNIGNFRDVQLVFGNQQIANPDVPLTEPVSITSNKGLAQQFTVSIASKANYDKIAQYAQGTEDIVVYSSDGYVVGSVPRAHYPWVFEASKNPKATYFEPGLNLLIRASQEHSLSISVKVPSIYGAGADTFNVGGQVFEAFATDETNIRKPFSGPNALNSTSVFGLYKDDKRPVNAEGKEVADVVYIKNIEYVNGEYFRGVKKVCAVPIELKSCAEDSAMCVAARYEALPGDSNARFYCEDFFQKQMQYTGLRLCNKSDTNRVQIDVIPARGGPDGKIWSYAPANAPATEKKYCYTYDIIEGEYDPPIGEGTAELCRASLDPAQRVYPPSSDRPVGPYYYDPANRPFGGDIAIRDKTLDEMGSCFPIEQPICPAKTENDINWPEAAVGEISIGVCKPGLFPARKPLARYCLINSDSKSFAFDKIKGEVKCKEYKCSEQTIDNITWKETKAGTGSNGECKSGYTSRGSLFRQCKFNYDTLSAEYEPMSNVTGQCLKSK